MTTDETRKMIDRCVEEKKPLMIKYHGGSQPGAKRWVLPLMFVGEQLRARDVATNRAKMYSLAKIEIVDDRRTAPDYVEKPSEKRTLSNALKGKVGELTAQGWRVVLTEQSVEVFEAGNDTAIAGIRPAYTTTIRLTYDGSSVEESEEPKKQDGWRVFGPGFAQQIIDPDPDDDLSFGYKRLGAAVTAFLNQCRGYARKRR
jgi:hypothetical protein